jgi:DNA-binding transcriptional ArsR family regulator
MSETSETTETTETMTLVRAAAVEALLASGRATFTEDDLEQALDWLAEPARSEILRALRRSGWLEADPHGLHRLTEAGLRIHDALRRAVLVQGAQPPPIPDGLTLEEIIHALLGRGLEELATAGREALVPILSSPPLLTTKAVIQMAETHALQGHPAPRRRLNG